VGGTTADLQALPEPAIATIDQIEPDGLLTLLLTAPVPEDLLPAGYDDPQVVAWEEGDTDLAGSLGGVVVFVDPSDSGIAYIVFPDVRAAQRRLFETNDAAVAADRGIIVHSFSGLTFDGVDYPGRLIVFDDRVVCLVQVGPVLVIGSGSSEDLAANRPTAIAMAEAGAIHLLRLAARPDATPAAVATRD
jgi:hypothetical protein